MKKIVIIGGGLAGLILAIRLSRSGVGCLLIEKKSYPFHRVCGEYISNEAAPFLKSEGLFPERFSPPQLQRFQLSSVSGNSVTLPLDLGGFGISRYNFDRFLYEEACQLGVNFQLDTEVQEVLFSDEKFTIRTQVKEFEADLVIGSFGKRSKMDVNLDREFIRRRSPYVAVKHHILTDHEPGLIALHNFEGGYCGISNIEEGRTNLCYLVKRDVLKRLGNIAAMEREILCKNPFLERIFSNSTFLLDRPEVINEVSFETKSPCDNHILMAGDSAGMITPLCGNGMAMAIHAAKILSEHVTSFAKGKISRNDLETRYVTEWTSNFSKRLWAGRQIQKLFGSSTASNIAVNLAIYVRPVAHGMIRNTHGKVF
jgi:flavin-dependent dehydrogenase